MSALEGFITGFAGKLADDITERKQRARDYFDKQVEYARTTGLQNKQRVMDQVNANMSIVNQLRQNNVPDDIIMSMVNSNPESLGQMYNMVEQLRAEQEPIKGGRLTEDDWRAFIDVASDFKPPEMDMGEFIRQTYDPFSRAVRDPSFSQDPKGTFFSSMMGFGSMDEARAELDKTVIADGMTAGELIRYGDSRPQLIGGPSAVSVNYAALERKPKDLTMAEVATLNTQAESQIETGWPKTQQAFNEEFKVNLSEDVVGKMVDPNARQYVQDLIDRSVENIINMGFDKNPEMVRQQVENQLRLRGVNVDALKEPSTVQTLPRTDTETDAGGSPTVPEGGDSQITTTPPTGAPMTSDAPLSEPNFASLTGTFTEDGKVQTIILLGDNGDGFSTYLDESGNPIILKNALVREYFGK